MSYFNAGENMFNLFKRKQEIKLLKQKEKELNKIIELQTTINELCKEEKEILKTTIKTKMPRKRKVPLNAMSYIEY